jgi:glycosyltransferase involved in cell wall biosynthesis
MRLAYSCHDSIPSSDTNTQQIVWTLLEVARRTVEVDLFVPSIEAGASGDGRAAIAAYYGARPPMLPPALSIVPLGGSARSALARGWFDWRLPARLGRRTYDLVWTRDPVALLACVRARREVVFETYRPDFASAARFGLWRHACLKSDRLRGVVAHSQLAANAFIAAGIAESRCCVVHNGFAPGVMEPRLDRRAARAQLGLPGDAPLLVYAGHVGPKKGTDTLVRLAAALPGVQVLVLGVEPGARETRRIGAMSERLGASGLILKPRVALADVPAYLYAADCLIIPPSSEPLARFGRTVLPMKIFMYLAAGRPIVAPRLPDIEEVLTDGRTARLVPPGDITAAAAAVTALLADRHFQDHLSAQALVAAGEHTWAARAAKLLAFFAEIHPDTGFGRRQPAG